MCSRRKDQSKRFIDQGNLCVGEPQFYEALKQISEADIKIAVLHHPLDWLIPFDRRRVGNRLKRNCRFILHGHGHEPGASANTDTNGYHIVIPAGACYDRRKPPGSDYVFSYNYVHLNFDKDEGTVFLRRWSEENRTWLKDYETRPPDGKISFSIKGPEIPHQIPSPRADFTGRDDELRELLTHFEQGVIIAGIRGLGGIGKTELAYKLAQELKERYPDGQIMVGLEGTGEKRLTPADAMGRIIHAYDRQAVLPEDYAELDKLYRQRLYGKRALLLLDNAFDDKQTRPLIPPPTSGLIITSRHEFTLDKMKAIILRKLQPEKAVELLKKIVETSRPQEAERCEEQIWIKIAQLCGHLPLALRAAGSLLANTRDLMPAVYAEQLQDEHTRLGRIGSQGEDLDVEGSLNLSYRRLPRETASIFRLLSVFPYDFDAAAEEAICQDQGHTQLSNLVTWSLVEFEEETGRYHLHDLVRLFAVRLLEEEGKEVARSAALRRHAEYYIEVLSSATKLYQHGGKDQLTSLTKFDIERMNIAAGWGWTKDNFKDDNAAASLCNAYLNWPFLLGLRLHPKERVLWLETALAAARQLKNKGMEGANLGNLGVAYADLGDVRKAIEFYEMRLVIACEIGDRNGEGNAMGNLGNAYEALGDSRKAIEFYEKALNIEREIGDRRGEGQAMGNLGIAYTSLGDVRKAIEFYEKALNLDREICDQRAEGVVLGNLGIAYADLGDTKRAIEFYEKALNIDREIGDRKGEGVVLGSLGIAYADLGDTKRAIEFYERALLISREMEDKRNEGTWLGNLGNAYAFLGDAGKSIEFYEKRLAIAREIGDLRGEGNALWNMSLSLDTLGQRAKAIDSARCALKIDEQIESPHADRVRRKLAEWQR